MVKLLTLEPLSSGFLKVVRAVVDYQRSDGGRSGPHPLECVKRPPAAVMIPYDPRRDELILVRQFRIGAYMEDSSRGWALEFPAGLCDQESDPMQTARRELLEETGYQAISVEPVMTFLVNPGFVSERIHLFLTIIDAEHPVALGGGLEHEQEDIQTLRVTYDEALAMVADGRMDGGPPILALQWLTLNRARIRAEAAALHE
ncbi:NUDIX hydrolase [Magnetococcus marinus MC-1]|uniref:ADP-ribose pyrophosphatase n=1 Tax=Magnetococcus marinus (strain ATCC BAA-1437 / JCM 17883 / MC-1) TaxID=156889 RepID=A0L3U1_MAGMM|nr:NUDIX hydrolase [Magnetococcus marinus]ABK42634.1 NUDIX hydrolase [Magnetococcus marinus MC-1]